MAGPVLLLVAFAPLLPWGKASLREAAMRARGPAIAARGDAVAPGAATGEFHWQATLGAALAAWIATGTLLGLATRLRATGRIGAGALGMGFAHLGMAVVVAGIGLVSGYQLDKTVAMKPGEQATLGRYSFTFLGAAEIPGPNYAAMRGTLAVTSGGQPVATLAPEKRIYRSSRQTMTEAAIRYGFLGDVYVSLGEPLPERAWSVQLYVKPFVGWLWGGAALMALGGLLAAIGARAGRRDAGAAT